MAQWHWILTQKGKWHAWAAGDRRSACGRLNVEHLRERPAQRISQTVLPGENVCTTCSHRSGRTEALAAGTTSTLIDEWYGWLRIRLHHRHIGARVEAVRALACRLAELGPPQSPQVSAVFDELYVLFLTPTVVRKKSSDGKRLTQLTLPWLAAAVAALPPGAHTLTRLAATMRTYRLITRCDPAADHFHAVRVIETMLQIESPELYIQHLNDRGLTALAAMFHPNTLARAKKDTALRGLFAGTSEYWDSISEQLNIVRD